MDFEEIEELYKQLFAQLDEENHNIGKYNDCEAYNVCDLYEVLRQAKRVKTKKKYFEKLLNMVQGCGWCSTKESDIEASKEL